VVLACCGASRALPLVIKPMQGVTRRWAQTCRHASFMHSCQSEALTAVLTGASSGGGTRRCTPCPA
jgi:hypothetical protein